MNLPNQLNLLDAYKRQGFNDKQIKQILLGLENKVDVSVYADLKYNWEQMSHIRIGLENNVDVSIYADPKYHWIQMQDICLELQNNKKMMFKLKKQFSKLFKIRK